MSRGTASTTPLYEEHRRLEGKLVPFAGFRMPIQYPTGIRTEHHAVRKAAGLFDVSHMGQLEVRGPDALALVQRVTVNDAARLELGQAQYTLFCAEDGGVLDDVVVYRTSEDTYLMVVNAANRAADHAWVRSHLGGMNAAVEDRSDEFALLALQGPAASEILDSLVEIPMDLGDVGFFRFTSGRIGGKKTIVARTGYTGEDGFELFLRPADAPEVWRGLLDEGAEFGLLPVGLGARDTLRLEAGLCLYGNDLDADHTPLEAGLGWTVKFEKGEFVGREALLRQKEEGVTRRLSGIRLTERGFPRPGYPVVSEGRVVGDVTSGTLSPTLGEGIALAYLPAELADPDIPVSIRIRDRDVDGRVAPPPFYREGSLKK